MTLNDLLKTHSEKDIYVTFHEMDIDCTLEECEIGEEEKKHELIFIRSYHVDDGKPFNLYKIDQKKYKDISLTVRSK